MKPDPIIDEIRRVRHEISAECGHDPKRLLEYYLELERKIKETGEFRFADAPSTDSAIPTQSASQESMILREEPRKKQQ